MFPRTAVGLHRELANIDQLTEARIFGRIDEIIGQNYSEGLVATIRFAIRTAWPSPSGSFCRTVLTLAMRYTCCAVSSNEDFWCWARECSSSELISKWSSVTTLPAAGCDRLFNAVLNDRFVDDWQHLLRHSLGHR